MANCTRPGRLDGLRSDASDHCQVERSSECDHVGCHAFTLDLLTDEGVCVGALVWRPGIGRMLIWAKQTILASGGAGMVYRETTNPPVATGDGMAAAYRAGAELRDMEFMQFHPTVLYVAGSSRFLISEAVRARGRTFATRTWNGSCSRSILTRGLHPATSYRRRSSAAWSEHAIRTCTSTYAISTQPWSADDFRGSRKSAIVRPGHHHRPHPDSDRHNYMIGGVTVDAQGRTTLPGLWAAGEVTSSGLHGADRLASNSLLEGLVFGVSCANGAAEAAAKLPDQWQARKLWCRYGAGKRGPTRCHRHRQFAAQHDRTPDGGPTRQTRA